MPSQDRSTSHKVIIADSAYGGARDSREQAQRVGDRAGAQRRSVPGRLPGSLAAQTGVGFEIIVVNDASTDRTREIAQSFPLVRVVDADPPPPGWTGKNNAMAAGARVAGGEWLLFTDADTVH